MIESNILKAMRSILSHSLLLCAKLYDYIIILGLISACNSFIDIFRVTLKKWLESAYRGLICDFCDGIEGSRSQGIPRVVYILF